MLRPARALRSRRRGWNRTPTEVEHAIVRLHVEARELGAGQLRELAYRVLGFRASRDTFRRILLRNRELIRDLEGPRRPRHIRVRRSNSLWGLDLTTIWVLGLVPVCVLGIVDYHGGRIVSLETLWRPSAEHVARALHRACEAEGAPRRILTDRAKVFRSRVFHSAVRARGITHTMTKPRHPWTNGRIERVFRTLKETLARVYGPLRSRGQLVRALLDFKLFYNAHRPHQSNGGRTPDEVHQGRRRRPGHHGRLALFEGRMLWWRFS